MKCINTVLDWRGIRKTISSQQSIGLLTTMGSLHQGHAALLERARQENDIAVLSIFINPTQFNDPKDFERYPKNLEQDLALAKQLGIDYVFVPEVDTIYPDGNIFSIQSTHPLVDRFEGSSRPGHFTGMLTVVMKLLQIISPTRTYFGEKDYQQAQLVTAMSENLFLDIDVITCQTVRLASGLPLSSRNSLLTEKDKILAERAATLIKTTTCENLSDIKQKLLQLGAEVEYLDVYQQRVFSAIRIAGIRLIDNFSL